MPPVIEAKRPGDGTASLEGFFQKYAPLLEQARRRRLNFQFRGTRLGDYYARVFSSNKRPSIGDPRVARGTIPRYLRRPRRYYIPEYYRSPYRRRHYEEYNNNNNNNNNNRIPPTHNPSNYTPVPSGTSSNPINLEG